MERVSTLQRTLLPIGFFGVLISALMLSDTFGPHQQATTIVVNGEKPMVQQTPEPPQLLPRCKTDEDCPLPTTYCSVNGKCTELDHPVCDCSQPQVLRCYETSGKARFLYCPSGCQQTETSAICK